MLWMTDWSNNKGLGMVEMSPYVSSDSGGFAYNSLFLEPVASEVNWRTIFAGFQGGEASKCKIGLQGFKMTDAENQNRTLSQGLPFDLDPLSPFHSMTRGSTFGTLCRRFIR